MREQGLHEGCMEQIQRMFATLLYRNDGASPTTDDNNRLRADDWELRDEVQEPVKKIWPTITTENLFQETDYQLYKDEFMKLFGFGIDGVDYEAEVNPDIEYDVISI
jgi:enoyl-[acyl-carrier protein] reductase/trans-2-enoyl-CoA reductase (NAD+)